MQMILKDPAIWVALGVILIAVIPLIWALGRLVRKAPVSDEGLTGGDLSPLPAADDLFGGRPPLRQDPSPAAYQELNPPPFRESRTPTSAAPANREMVDRLENMSQRLTDMQSVLQRQSSTPTAGSPLPMETIDKLLKIIGNVTQQVDQLQRSLGGTPSTPSNAAPAPAPQSTAPQASAPRPGPSPIPPAAKAPPTATGPGLRGIGIAGGALSRQPPGTTPGPGTPPATPPAK